MRQIQKSIADCIARAKFVALSQDDMVSTAVTAMSEMGTDCALVVEENEKLVGIFTERDFLNRVSAAKRDPSATRLGDVMTADPETLHPHDCVSYAINRMAVGSYRNVPIVDDKQRPTSVLDVRLVMLHLIKVFAEVEKGGGATDDEEWIDIGGG